jgi:hypothetical protein
MSETSRLQQIPPWLGRQRCGVAVGGVQQVEGGHRIAERMY